MLRQIYTATEVDRLMDACNGGFTGRRNRTMICVLYRTGLRIGELLKLEPRDVDLEAMRVLVRHGKGGKTRAVPLDCYAEKALRDYLRDREKLQLASGAPLFVTLQGHRIWDTYIRKLLPNLARLAGVEKRVHAHGFRHTFATELVLEGRPLCQVRDLLGHTNIATTNGYVAESTIKLDNRTWGDQ